MHSLDMALALALSLVFGSHVHAQVPNADCKLRHPADWVSSLTQLPEPIYDELLARVGAIADAGQPFNSTDVGGGVKRRFIKAGHSGNVWFVWYEHGGLGYHLHAAFFSLGVIGYPPKPAPKPFVLGNFAAMNLCAATDAFLDGVHPAIEW